MSGTLKTPKPRERSSGLPRATTMKVTPANRDALARIAVSLGAGSLDDAVTELIFVYESLRAVERLSEEQVAEWRAEAQQWAEGGGRAARSDA